LTTEAEDGSVRWFLVLLAAAAPAFALAAETAATGDALLGITGTDGAAVRIDGDSIGCLPLDPITLPLGVHTLRFTKRGYESRTDEILLGPNRGESRAVYLHAKRKRDAIWRSLLVPGWGSVYSEHRLRGLAAFVAEAGILGYAYLEEGRFQDRMDEYEAADLAYRRAVDDEAIAAARTERDEAYDRLESSETNRNRALIAAAVVHGLSILDAIVGFPYTGDSNGEGLVVSPGLGERGEGASVALRFLY
jgi:hypothetical protein